MANDDDRQFLRAPAKLEVRITAETGACVRGNVQDVSVAGLFVSCGERLPVGTLCELLVEITGGDVPGPIDATGRVAHVEPDGMGIQITELALEDYEELRRLVSRDDSDV